MLAIPTFVYLTVYWVCLVGGVFAFIDAIRHRPDAFAAVSNQSKNFWLVLLGVGLGAQVLFPALSGGLLSALGLAGIVAAIVYVVAMRPKLIEVSRGR